MDEERYGQDFLNTEEDTASGIPEDAGQGTAGEAEPVSAPEYLFDADGGAGHSAEEKPEVFETADSAGAMPWDRYLPKDKPAVPAGDADPFDAGYVRPEPGAAADAPDDHEDILSSEDESAEAPAEETFEEVTEDAAEEEPAGMPLPDYLAETPEDVMENDVSDMPSPDSLTEVPEEDEAEDSWSGTPAGQDYASAGEQAPDAPEETPYHSKYDSYRFETPEPPAGDPGGPGPKKPRKPMPPLLKTLLIAAGLFLGLILAMIGLAFGIDRVVKKPAAPASGTESGQEIVLGAQDADEAESSAESLAGSEPDEEVTRALPGAAPEEEPDAEEEAPAEKEAAPEEEPAGEETAVPAVLPAEQDLPGIVEKAMPSMVSITNVTLREYRDLFGQTGEYENVSAGSGIIVGQTETDYLIATNHHVIDGSNEITVAFCDDTTAEGTLKGSDADYDLAIVSVPVEALSEETRKAVSIIAVGNSDDVVVGEDVLAIGNTLGYGQSVSRGIVSAVGRELTDRDGTVRTMIQTDASINPGNSGGALLNMRGELIGINEAKAVDESVEGVGYAIPMAIAEPILDKLGSREVREKVDDGNSGYLGVTVMTVPAASAGRGMPAGVYVSTVVENGPADQAGILVGDIITTVEGNAIKGNDDLLEQLSYYAAGETVSISVSRLNEEQTAFSKVHMDVTLGSRTEAFGEEGKKAAPEGTDSVSGAESAENGDFGGYYGGLFDDNDEFFEDNGGR